MNNNDLCEKYSPDENRLSIRDRLKSSVYNHNEKMKKFASSVDISISADKKKLIAFALITVAVITSLVLIILLFSNMTAENLQTFASVVTIIINGLTLITSGIAVYTAWKVSRYVKGLSESSSDSNNILSNVAELLVKTDSTGVPPAPPKQEPPPAPPKQEPPPAPPAAPGSGDALPTTVTNHSTYKRRASLGLTPITPPSALITSKDIQDAYNSDDVDTEAFQ